MTNETESPVTGVDNSAVSEVDTLEFPKEGLEASTSLSTNEPDDDFPDPFGNNKEPEETVEKAEETVEAKAEETVEDAEETVETTEEAERDEEFGYIPEKFMVELEGKDGEKERVPDFKKMAESYKELEKKMSSGDVAHRPKSADEYEYDFGENAEAMSEQIQDFNKNAYDAGLSKKQYAWAVDMYNKQIEKALDVQAEYTENQLKREWGKDFDANIAVAERGLAALGDFDVSKSPELANNAMFIKMMYNLGKNTREDSSQYTRTSETPPKPTVDRDELMKLNAELFAMDDLDPRKKHLDAKITKLYKKLGKS